MGEGPAVEALDPPDTEVAKMSTDVGAAAVAAAL